MKIDYVNILVLAFLPLFIRTILYLLALRIRSIHITLLSCVIVAGAPSLIGFFPLPLPTPLKETVSFVLGVFLAMFLLTRYTEAELFPDIVLIPIVVELASGLVLGVLLIPFLTSWL